MEIYLLKDGEQVGPYRAFEIKTLIERGTFTGDDLAWFREAPAWRPVREIETLAWMLPENQGAGGAAAPGADDGPDDRADREAEPPPPLEPVKTAKVAPGGDVLAPGDPAQPVPRTRPWRRFWARCCDGMVIRTLVALIAFAVQPWAGDEYVATVFRRDVAFVILVSVAWALLEAFALSNWGTTVGKALLGMRVVGSDGGRLGLGPAVKRSFLVLLLGWGLGLFPVREMSLVLSFLRLRQLGATYWDERVGSKVVFGELTPVRIALFVAVFLALVAATAALLWDVAMPEVQRFIEELEKQRQSAEGTTPA